MVRAIFHTGTLSLLDASTSFFSFRGLKSEKWIVSRLYYIVRNKSCVCVCVGGGKSNISFVFVRQEWRTLDYLR